MAKRVGPYWTDAKADLEVLEPGDPRPRPVPLGRPFALVGRLPEAEVRLDSREVGARHVYLHADARGIFAVDLATRTGTRFGEVQAPCGWLRPGESIEVAGRVVRLARFEIAGRVVQPPPCADNPLADAGSRPLVGLSLEPIGHRGVSWTLGSEMAFVGRGDGCAIRLNQASVSRTHCVLFRTELGAWVVDLPGRPTLVNGQPPRGASPIRDGDTITFGQVRFVARVGVAPASILARAVDAATPPRPTRVGPRREAPAPAPDRPLPLEDRRTPRATRPDLAGSGPSLVPEVVSGPGPGGELARIAPRSGGELDLIGPDGLPATLEGTGLPLDLVPPESRGAVLGWMLGALHAGQSEILRRQDELENSVATSLAMIMRQLQEDSSSRRESQEALADELRKLNARADESLAAHPTAGLPPTRLPSPTSPPARPAKSPLPRRSTPTGRSRPPPGSSAGSNNRGRTRVPT